MFTSALGFSSTRPRDCVRRAFALILLCAALPAACDPAARYFLGRMYERGDGVVKSPSAAALWYYHSGMIWLKWGRRDDAMANMDAIKRIAPGNEYLKPLNDAIHATPLVEKK